MHGLTNLSPLDGRYENKVEALRPLFSEYGLIYHRFLIEVRWLQALVSEPLMNLGNIDQAQCQHKLEAIISAFNQEAAEKIKALEQTTNHDVKAVEYYLKSCLEEDSTLAPLVEFTHFACTSEDINNLAYSLMLQRCKEDIIAPELNVLCKTLQQKSHDYSNHPMLARTHGQPASPTTMGKEFANFVARLHRQQQQLAAIILLGKMNGAVGNFNAHVVAYPDIDWPQLTAKFIEKLGLKVNIYTTQIEPHDCIAELCHCLSRINTILMDFSRDIWGYISLDYFQQKTNHNEVGSSTMPHKVNPIDFENAEGNLGIANSLLQHFANKLPISRWQRDLSDSTVLRNLGVAIGHMLVSLKALHKGIDKLQLNQAQLEHDLENHWQVLAEPIQTVMRRYQIPNPYEQLKQLTRGKKISQKTIADFIQKLDVPETAKQQLLALTPQKYTGLAQKLVEDLSNL